MYKNSESENFCKLSVYNLSHDTNEKSFITYFKQWGEITRCVLARDPHTGISRGFGFITYKRAHMVEKTQAARPHTIDGQLAVSRRFIPQNIYYMPGGHRIVNTLYVSGLEEDLCEEDLRDYFDPYGNIVKVTVITRKNTNKRGFAFIQFDDYDPVDKILQRRHKYKGRKLDVQKALSSETIPIIKIEKGMGGLGRGASAGGRGKCRTADEFDRGYGGGYGDSCYGVPYEFSCTDSSDSVTHGFGSSYGVACGFDYADSSYGVACGFDYADSSYGVAYEFGYGDCPRCVAYEFGYGDCPCGVAHGFDCGDNSCSVAHGFGSVDSSCGVAYGFVYGDNFCGVPYGGVSVDNSCGIAYGGGYLNSAYTGGYASNGHYSYNYSSGAGDGGLDGNFGSSSGGCPIQEIRLMNNAAQVVNEVQVDEVDDKPFVHSV